MIDKENRLIEDIWYHVKLLEEYHYRPPIKVEGKFHFVGRLVIHLNNKVVFNLQENKGSVVLPFDFIEWMVPLHGNPKREERNWLDDL